MATPSEKLAQSLDVLRQIQETGGSPVIKSADISRTHLEREQLGEEWCLSAEVSLDVQVGNWTVLPQLSHSIPSGR